MPLSGLNLIPFIVLISQILTFRVSPTHPKRLSKFRAREFLRFLTVGSPRVLPKGDTKVQWKMRERGRTAGITDIFHWHRVNVGLANFSRRSMDGK